MLRPCATKNTGKAKSNEPRIRIFTFTVVLLEIVAIFLAKRLEQAFRQLNSPLQKLAVADALFCPALHHFIDAEALFPAKLLIKQVRVVDDLTHHPRTLVADPKDFHQRFKGAILTAVPKSSLVHVKRHSVTGFPILVCKNELRLRIYKPANQPGRHHPIDARARARNPLAAAICGWRNLARLGSRRFGLWFLHLSQSLFDLRAQGATEKIN